MPVSEVEVPRIWCGLRKKFGGVPRGWIEVSNKYQFDAPEGIEEDLGIYDNKVTSSNSRFTNRELQVRI